MATNAAKKTAKKRTAKKRTTKKQSTKKRVAKKTTKKSPPKTPDPIIERARALVKRRKGIEEQRMFGGVCFMVEGNMAFGGGSKNLQGRLMVRVGPDAYDGALKEKHASVMDFTGRVIRGFVVVDAKGLKTDAQLKKWIDRGIRFARSLPPK